jgi:hypothetical protein
MSVSRVFFILLAIIYVEFAVVQEVIVSLQEEIVIDEVGKWLNTTIIPNIVSGGGYVTALELIFLPSVNGEPGKLQVIVHVQNSSSYNKTIIQEGMQDAIFNDDSVYNAQKSSASVSRKTLPYFMILLINTLTLLSTSFIFSSMEYIIYFV